MYDTIMTATGFSVVFVATAAGAALVFFCKQSRAENPLFSGLAAGIMVAASLFSLLLPSIDGFMGFGRFRFAPAAFSFLVGGAFFALTDGAVRRFLSGAEGSEKKVRPIKTFAAMTVHNIPEGLAVGFAFGSAASGGAKELAAALALAVGIAVQNFPEGAAVSMPLYSAGTGRMKAFMLGALSGAVEPIAAIVGFIFSTSIVAALPYIMAFAAGTMVFVVVEDLIPAAGENKLAPWGFMAGFAIMMALDVALG